MRLWLALVVLCLFALIVPAATAGDCYAPSYGGYTAPAYSSYAVPAYGAYYSTAPAYGYTYYADAIIGDRVWPGGWYARVNGSWYRYGYGYEYGRPLATAIYAPPALSFQPVLPAPQRVVEVQQYPQAQAQPQAQSPEQKLTPEELMKLKIILSQMPLQVASPPPVAQK